MCVLMPSKCGTGKKKMWYWRRILKVHWTARWSNQTTLREISPEYSLEGLALKLKLQYFRSSDVNSQLIGKVPDAGKDWGQEKRVSEDKMAGCHHWCSGHALGQTSGDGEGQGGLACCSPCGRKQSDMTGQLNSNMIHYHQPNSKVLGCTPESNIL